MKNLKTVFKYKVKGPKFCFIQTKCFELCMLEGLCMRKREKVSFSLSVCLSVCLSLLHTIYSNCTHFPM